MADLVITAANVQPNANTIIDRSGTAGATITAGEPVYKDPTTKQWLLADNNSATAAARQASGVSLNSSAAGQPLAVATGGDLTLGPVMTAGTAYFVSATPGMICPDADVGAGSYPCLLGLAKSTSVLTLSIQFPNVSR